MMTNFRRSANVNTINVKIQLKSSVGQNYKIYVILITFDNTSIVSLIFNLIVNH